MEKDKVESRTDNENTSYYKEVLERQGYIVSRPSVPQQGQALSFKEWGKDKFEIDDTHVLFKDVQDYGDYRAALAASRSEAATPHVCKLESFMGYSLTELVAIINQHKQAGAPAAGSTERLCHHAHMSLEDCRCEKFQDYLINRTNIRFLRDEECKAFVVEFGHLLSQGTTLESAIKPLQEVVKIKAELFLTGKMPALAGTDTDVAKEK